MHITYFHLHVLDDTSGFKISITSGLWRTILYSTMTRLSNLFVSRYLIGMLLREPIWLLWGRCCFEGKDLKLESRQDHLITQVYCGMVHLTNNAECRSAHWRINNTHGLKTMVCQLLQGCGFRSISIPWETSSAKKHHQLTCPFDNMTLRLWITWHLSCWRNHGSGFGSGRQPLGTRLTPTCSLE